MSAFDVSNVPNSSVEVREPIIEKIHPQHWCGQHNFGTEPSRNFYDYSTLKDKQKSAMCRIAEIARYNKIRHYYDLQDESGPAHKKLFTVRLVLTPEETFEGSGSSIKRAQQSSAEIALQKTKLPLPTEKPARKKHIDITRPDRVLQNVCRSLNYTTPHYVACNPPVYPDPGSPVPEHILIPSSATVLYGVPFPNLPIDPMRPMGPKLQVVIVNINGKSIATGIGESFPLAKQDAASNALVVLKPILEERHTETAQCNHDSSDYVPKYKQKSVISDIHERAHQLKTNVIFEVLKEEGPPHDRQYIVRCAFVTANNTVKAEATGKGKKKKTAQQEACAQLLKIVENIRSEKNTMTLASNVCKTQQKIAALNREPKRKTIVKDKKMDPLYGHQINPVSRLIQIMQAKNQGNPTFQLIAEHGISKYKEFIIRVQCGDKECEGKGPNKRLAKRAAAEMMLECIGYIKPLPSPGKSLLKKNQDIIEENTLNNESSLSERPDLIIDNSSKSNQTDEAHHQQLLLVETVGGREASLENEKRRVTFNSQVHACPPPGDEDYPNSIITALKKDTIVEGKIRRLKRMKENRRALTAEQVLDVSNRVKKIIVLLNDDSAIKEKLSAYYQLDQLSNEFKFSVQYTTFPEASPSQHFTIVSLGLEEPLVAHGTGSTTSEADETAALAALVKLKDILELKKNQKNAIPC